MRSQVKRLDGNHRVSAEQTDLVRRKAECPICAQIGPDWCAECPSPSATSIEIEAELEFARMCSRDLYLQMMVELANEGGADLNAA